jgi:hypothetical protein
MRDCRNAVATACVRVSASSFAIALRMLVRTVSAAMPSSAPIASFARPSLIGRLAGDAAHDTGNASFGLVGLVDLLREGEPLVRERIELLHGRAPSSGR